MTTKQEPTRPETAGELPPPVEAAAPAPPAPAAEPPAPAVEPPAPPVPATDDTNWTAVVSVTLAVAGLVVAWFWWAAVGALMGWFAYSLGKAGRGFADQHHGKGKALAITGQVVGIVTLVLGVLGALVTCAAGA